MTDDNRRSQVGRTDLAALARDCRKVRPEIRKAIPRRLRAAAQPIVDQAKVEALRASPGGHIKVSARTRLTGRNGAQVKIIGRSPAKPALAGLLERGNKGSNGASTFRHPVFQGAKHVTSKGVTVRRRTVWVQQATHPFIQPAVNAHQEDVVRAIGDVADDIRRVLRAT